MSCPGYVAHELSGFIASWEAIDEPDDMATGPQDAEVSGCFEPLKRKELSALGVLVDARRSASQPMQARASTVTMKILKNVSMTL